MMDSQADKNNQIDENSILRSLENLTQKIEALNNKVNYLLKLQGVYPRTIREVEKGIFIK